MVSVEIHWQAFETACRGLVSRRLGGRPLLSPPAQLALLDADWRGDMVRLACSVEVAAELSTWFRVSAEDLVGSSDQEQRAAGPYCQAAADWLGRALGS